MMYLCHLRQNPELQKEFFAYVHAFNKIHRILVLFILNELASNNINK